MLLLRRTWMTKNPFDAIRDFENALSDYTGAPYVITTDCCTHAIELCFRYKKYNSVTVPKHTYLSVPMVFHKLNIPYTLIDQSWNNEYNFGFTNIWDSARYLMPQMHKPGQMQCLSFGRTKPLEIGRGGAILTDDKNAYDALKKMSYDGRDLSISPWEKQQSFSIGYHYRMLPEECIIGLTKLNNNDITHSSKYTYPDLSTISIT